MSRSYKKQPFWTACGWCSTDKVWASRGKRRAQNRAVSFALKKDDFDNFLLPHTLECSWNNTYQWTSDGKKYYHSLFRRYYDWEDYLKWKDVTEEELKVMEVEDVLDGKFATVYPNFWKEPWGEKSSITLSRRDFEEYHVWPPLWWRKMHRK